MRWNAQAPARLLRAASRLNTHFRCDVTGGSWPKAHVKALSGLLRAVMAAFDTRAGYAGPAVEPFVGRAGRTNAEGAPPPEMRPSSACRCETRPIITAINTRGAAERGGSGRVWLQDAFNVSPCIARGECPFNCTAVVLNAALADTLAAIHKHKHRGCTRHRSSGGARVPSVAALTQLRRRMAALGLRDEARVSAAARGTSALANAGRLWPAGRATGLSTTQLEKRAALTRAQLTKSAPSYFLLRSNARAESTRRRELPSLHLGVQDLDASTGSCPA
ncbi:hypothetical protein ON010_g1803 [Phytophthora cinnamomi]|nr:hypothetical protein ON010_g1803 [Phytophthora cinnamomi]